MCRVGLVHGGDCHVYNPHPPFSVLVLLEVQENQGIEFFPPPRRNKVTDGRKQRKERSIKIKA